MTALADEASAAKWLRFPFHLRPVSAHTWNAGVLAAARKVCWALADSLLTDGCCGHGSFDRDRQSGRASP